jgi:hypothetical protein
MTNDQEKRLILYGRIYKQEFINIIEAYLSRVDDNFNDIQGQSVGSPGVIVKEFED